jgi:hypothetical protein
MDWDVTQYAAEVVALTELVGVSCIAEPNASPIIVPNRRSLLLLNVHV